MVFGKKLRGQIYEDYGAGTTEDIEELEKEFDKAEFKGRTMQLSDSMTEYLVWVTKQQTDLVDKIPEESRPGYQYFGPSVLAKTIIKTTPPDYITAVQNLKQNSMVRAKIAALENPDDPPVESKFGEDWIPELSKLKKTLTAEWRARFKDLSSESTPAMIGWGSYAEVLGLRRERSSARRSKLQTARSLCRKHLPRFLEETESCWQGCHSKSRWRWRRQQSWHEAQEWRWKRVPLLQAYWNLQVRKILQV